MKKIISFIKKYKLVFLIILAVIIYFSTNLLLPEKTEEVVEKVVERDASKEQPSWKSVIPGQDLESNLKEKLGNPINTVDEDNYQILSYASQNPNFHNQVYVDKNDNKITFIKEVISFKQNMTSHIITSKYGETKNIYIKASEGYFAPIEYLYVYPNTGVAYLAHIKTKAIYEIWYFEPQTMEKFKETWIGNYQKVDFFN